MAESLGLDDLRVHALTTVGSAKEQLGDTTGRRDLELAVELGRAANSPMVAGALNNLTVYIDTTDMRRVDELNLQAQEEAERYGDATLLRFLRGNAIAHLWVLGKWDEAVSVADDLVAQCERGSPHVLEGPTRLFRGCIGVARGKGRLRFPTFAARSPLREIQPRATPTCSTLHSFATHGRICGWAMSPRRGPGSPRHFRTS